MNALALLEGLGGFLIPGLIILVALTFVISIMVMASRYKKIPPNAVGIFYGRKYKYVDPADNQTKERGFRMVAGGGSLLLPIIEQLQVMSTAAFQTTLSESNIPNRENVKISVRGVATCKISTTPEDLHNAAMNFLGKPDEEIQQIVTQILMGHLRSIIGKLDIDEILRKRDEFNRQVVEESTAELKDLGIQVITLVIQEVNDEHGYIDALGQRAVAEAKRDAAIKVAEADAETKKKTSDAQREAAVVVANNAVQIAEAEKNRDVQRAQFKVTADNELAKANQALSIATAAQEQTLLVAQADRDAAEKQAQIKVQEKEAARHQAELQATLVVKAEAERKAAVVNADAAKQVAVINAEAAQQKAVIDANAAKSVLVLQAEATSESSIKAAEGKRQAAIKEGEGQASQTRAVLTAKADGEAAVIREARIAEADGEAAKKGRVLLAEAEGTLKLAEALGTMTDRAQLILILDRLPRLIELGGDAGAKIAQAMFAAVAAPLGQIDSIHITDLGGGSTTGKVLENLSTIVPTTVAKALAALKLSGIDITKILEILNIDASKLVGMLGQSGAQPAAASEAPKA